MDDQDIFVWPDGSFLYRHEYSELTDRWRGEDYVTLFAGTDEYQHFLNLE
ncbi:hypothetical protein MUA04_14370 [Enterobacteriaceae bacterium H11S18]|nr:hypothetical protein [Dryocola clanedunensis]MCT4711365.1 hypothetical protein [Dryocola clanedunensis]